MPIDKSDRSLHFPAIEKKYGHKMSYWHSLMKEIADLKYPEQIAYLRENHGMSQAHANALVMYSRGSKSTKRYASFKDYLAPHDAIKQKTVKAIFKTITDKYPKMEMVIAWNQPMLKLGTDYIIGINILKNHILIGPWGEDAIAKIESKLKGLKANKKTVQVPVDWQVDEKLILEMVKNRVKELK